MFDARFNGRVDTKDVPNGLLSIDAAGTPKLISIRKLNYSGEAGAVKAKGVIDLRRNLGWSVTGRFDNFNLGYFLPNAPNDFLTCATSFFQSANIVFLLKFSTNFERNYKQISV